ncbi:MAG TPA: DUF2235 domain-containing protein [Patescibacteria group bacterium]|nr:DUF2235 domain-containing protein [Patescibacteria group bacterium]
MGKKIVLCFDGTWNTPENETNIHKIYEAVGPESEKLRRFYYTGVGTEGGPLKRVFAGAIGEGIADKIRQGYDDLASIYEPGDQIYIFGFSRGAFAARCLANMVASFGLPTRYYDSPEFSTSSYSVELGDKIFKAYKRRDDEMPLELRNHCVAKAEVQMLGVFDTVASLGIAALHGGVSTLRYGHLDAEWHPNILNTYQALAIDEKRPEFKPMRFKKGPGAWDPNHGMEQVWFPGVHSDVGGGYDQSGHAENALSWMIKRSQGAGLAFDAAKIGEYAVQAHEELADIHESWNPLWGPARVRDIPEGSAISGYVELARAIGDYNPCNLPFNGAAAKVSPDGADIPASKPQPGDWVPLKVSPYRR